MVNQNSNVDAPQSDSDPQPSGTASQDDGLSTPSVVKAGETMLIISLVLIFLVCFFVALHFYLKRRKGSRRKKTKISKKEKPKKSEGPELHSQEKKVAELVGTPVCEMGESEPRHEMEDVEVPEQYATDLEAQRPREVETATTSSTASCGTETTTNTHSAAGPEVREYAIYWSRAL